MDKSISPVFMSPANPVVARRKIKDRVSNSKDPDQATILAISDQEANAAAESLGYGNGPQEGGKSEEPGVQGLWPDLNKFGIDQSRIDLISTRKVLG